MSYRNVINPGGGPIDIPDVRAFLAMHDEDDEPYVDLGGDMIVPLRELVTDLDEDEDSAADMWR